jgi:Cu2+-exporting ATPase
LSSRHPLARAVAHEAHDRTPYADAVEVPGEGVRAMLDGSEARLGSPAFCGVAAPAVSDDPGTSVIAFSHGGRSAVLLIRQQLRPDAVPVVMALRRRGLEVMILSGDRKAAVAPVAGMLGIRNWSGGMTPVEKIAVIDDLKAKGRRVLMVGDGLNDAPALAAAHVSLSPIDAAHITQAQADAVFMGEWLKPVLDAVVIASRARRLMSQNLWLAVIYNAVAVPIAIAGLVTPLIAALAMSGSSILVTLNALRASRREDVARPATLPAPSPSAAVSVVVP